MCSLSFDINSYFFFFDNVKNNKYSLFLHKRMYGMRHPHHEQQETTSKRPYIVVLVKCLLLLLFKS